MIDIIIPTYNRRKHLEATLASILNQNVDIKLINVVVSDDGSSDGSIEVVEKYADKLNLKYFFQEDEGYRAGRARNIGLKNSSEDIFLLIDSGIVLESRCVEKHLNLHQKYSEPIAIIGYVYGFDNKESDLTELDRIVDKFRNIDDVIRHLDTVRKFLDVREDEYSKYDYQIHELMAPWVYFWSGHVSINRACIKNEEFFDVVFEPRYGYEDIDLGYRLHERNIKIFLEKEAKAFHYPHKKIKHYDDDLKINAKVFYDKHKADIIELFNNHGGTFGFNDLLPRKIYESI